MVVSSIATDALLPCLHTLATFKIPLSFPTQKLHSLEERGVSDLFLGGILIFLLLRSPCNISKPYDNPFWGFE